MNTENKGTVLSSVETQTAPKFEILEISLVNRDIFYATGMQSSNDLIVFTEVLIKKEQVSTIPQTTRISDGQIYKSYKDKVVRFDTRGKNRKTCYYAYRIPILIVQTKDIQCIHGLDNRCQMENWTIKEEDALIITNRDEEEQNKEIRKHNSIQFPNGVNRLVYTEHREACDKLPWFYKIFRPDDWITKGNKSTDSRDLIYWGSAKKLYETACSDGIEFDDDTLKEQGFDLKELGWRK